MAESSSPSGTSSPVKSASQPDTPPSPPTPAAGSVRSPTLPSAHLPSRPSPLGSSRSTQFANNTPPSRTSQAGSLESRRVSVGGLDSGKSGKLRTVLSRTVSGNRRTGPTKILGIQDRLRKEVDGVVKRRQGSVLARGYVDVLVPLDQAHDIVIGSDSSSRPVSRRSSGRMLLMQPDHYPTGRALDLDLTIQGAPNFRAPDEEGLNVYGVGPGDLSGSRQADKIG